MNIHNHALEQPESETDQQEYIQYAQEVEQTLTRLEAGLHNSDDPDEIMMGMLQAATVFYDADWAGILEADLSTKIWSPLLWYNRNKNGMTPNYFDELEEGEYLTRWIDALINGTPIIVRDIEEIKESAPLEHNFMILNSVKTLLAVPFWKRPTGFLIVRNPKKYISRSSLLQMMAFIAVSSINEKRLQNSLKIKSHLANIHSDHDVIINLFGEVQIITSRGMLTEKELNSTLLSSFVAYMMLHRNRPASPAEIFADLYPEENNSGLSKSVIAKRAKNIVYRLNNQFELISEHKLFELTTSGYRFNPELRIQSDTILFEDYWNQAQMTVDLSDKISILKKAITVYKQGLYADYYDVPWFISSRSHYAIRYSGVVSLLLSTLNRLGDYRCIHEYANAALPILPGSQDIYYWLIYAIVRLGAKEIAAAELTAAKTALTADDFSDLKQRLQESGITL